MSFKRRVLSALGKDHLLEIGRGLELDVTTRMGVEELRDALAKSKRAKLDAIVQESLSRDTLKEICSAVGLDDTGKEKAAPPEGTDICFVAIEDVFAALDATPGGQWLIDRMLQRATEESHV